MFVPAKTLWDSSWDKEVTCYQSLTRFVPEFRKKRSDHIFHSQFSVFSSLGGGSAADKPQSFLTELRIYFGTGSQGGGRDGLTLGYDLASPTGTKRRRRFTTRRSFVVTRGLPR